MAACDCARMIATARMCTQAVNMSRRCPGSLKGVLGLSDNAGSSREARDHPNVRALRYEAISPNGYRSIAECKQTGACCPTVRAYRGCTCLRNCDEATDCYQSVTQEQSCVSLKDVDKKPVYVLPREGEQGVMLRLRR